MLRDVEGFQRYARGIQALPPRDKYLKSDLLTDRFRLCEIGSFAMYYAPFDYINPRAEVLLVGITPGWQQMEGAYREARRALHEGVQLDAVGRRVKQHASFVGSMRSNLIPMLDGIGLHRSLGLPTCADLFGAASHYVHTTSAIRYPVFNKEEDYRGSPDPLRVPVLRAMIYSLLREELELLPEALVIPLGSCVDKILEDLIANHVLARRRCLIGFPHASGSNGWRVQYFRERRDNLSRKRQRWFARQRSRTHL
jgi:hypothetical protein